MLISFCLLILLNAVRTYVIRIRVKCLTERFYTNAFKDEIYPDTDMTTRIAPTYFTLFHFLSAYAMRILMLIRRRGIGALTQNNNL